MELEEAGSTLQGDNSCMSRFSPDVQYTVQQKAYFKDLGVWLTILKLILQQI
jgi:hypothetical protein